MKRLLSIILSAAVLFYGVWPAYSGYSIKGALDAKDPDGLRQRIDFESVRSSLRPAIAAKVESSLDAAAEKAGPGGAKIFAALKTQIMPKIVEVALARVVTPEALIRVHAERGTIKDILNKIIGEQVAKSGGGLGGGIGGSDSAAGFDPGALLGGLAGKKEAAGATKQAPSAAGEPGAAPGITWRNVKGFGLDGPAGIYVRLAKDAAAIEPDLTAHMTFQGSGWMLTGLDPRL